MTGTGRNESTRVDLLGPPGIGKSTLCNSFLASDFLPGSHPSWIGMPEAMSIAARSASRVLMREKSFLTRFRKAMRHQLLALRFLSVNQTNFALNPSTELETLKTRLLLRFLSESSELVQALTEQWIDPETPLEPLPVRYYKLIQWTKEWLFTVRHAGLVNIFADNSRYTRGVAELLANETHRASAQIHPGRAYLDSMMAPAAIVHVTGTPEIVLHRIKNRERQMAGWRYEGHVNKSDRELAEYSERRLVINHHAASFFRAEGLPVLTLDAAADLYDSMHELSEFMHGIAGERK